MGLESQITSQLASRIARLEREARASRLAVRLYFGLTVFMMTAIILGMFLIR